MRAKSSKQRCPALCTQRSSYSKKCLTLGRRAKHRSLTHAHHRRGLAVEPQAAGKLCFVFFLLRNLLFEHHSNQV